MQNLLSILQNHAPFKAIGSVLAEGKPCYVEGLWGSSAAYLTAALGQGEGRILLCVFPQVEQAEEFVEDVALFAPDIPLLFPAWEAFEEDEVPDAEILSQRLRVLKSLVPAESTPDSSRNGHVIVAPVQALLQEVPSPKALKRNTLVLRPGLARPMEEVTSWLMDGGFQPVRQVEVPGEFCTRGGLLDIFPYTASVPVRVEFFGDEVESLRTFDPGMQSSLEELERISISAMPGHGGKSASVTREEDATWSSLFEYLAADSWIVLKEPAEVMQRAEIVCGRLGSGAGGRMFEALRKAVSRFPTLHLAALPSVFSGEPATFHVHSVERFGRELSSSIHELELVTSERARTVVFCNSAGERQRLMELLDKSSVVQSPRFEIRIGRLNHGFDWTDLSLALLTHHEIFRRYRQRRVTAKYRHTRSVAAFYELQPGDLVVHAVHGIGVFRGMEMLERGAERKECLRIEYADKAFLLVPASKIELVQKYVGPASLRPALSRLGTKGWLKRKQRAEEAVQDLAAEMLRLEAVREATRGIAYPPDNEWQREFEGAFPYEETEDQLHVAAEVKRDMKRARPMDRLICGDVGYGKTEVAMRAAFKAVIGGTQVAMLVPTTVLAAQHAQTFRERMADYPIFVEMLSRFLTRGEQGRVLADLADGRADIVIGTHRLVQPDVAFRNLGLVIIDEEQRFGVAHKERLKRLRETVDVLTLTATPIPRTLHMSLLGIRDISSLETPIRDRLAIHTRLQRFDPPRIRQAILHEMARDGQVFFVHNRVESIDAMAGRLRKLMPEAKIVVGHGQMSEHELARVMQQFVAQRADVLVCTTIIESGLDIPNVNTIMINRADTFGLADLHQLRGRVGRYKHRAYAYFLLPRDRPVTPVAEKRLKAIEEFCDLGAGFQVAMRDLEIRGAGNILGPEQSGHIAAVGYDMYCRLLEQSVRALKNEPIPERPDVTLSLGLECFLPKSYVSDAVQRIDLYRKFQQASTSADLERLRGELGDRYGEPPPEAENLLSEARTRQLAGQAGVSSLRLHRGAIVVQTATADRVMEMFRAAGQSYRQVDANTLHLPVKGRRMAADFLLSWLSDMFERGLSAVVGRVGEPTS